MLRGLYLTNLSNRDLIFDGIAGNPGEIVNPVDIGTYIPTGWTNFHLADMVEPHAGSTSQWGWLYLKTKPKGNLWTKLTLFVYVDESKLKEDHCYAGFRQRTPETAEKNLALCDSMLCSARQSISGNPEKYRSGGDFLYTIDDF